MTKNALTDRQRKLIYALALGARELLTREARELLEGTYGLYRDGKMDPPEKLPEVQTDSEAEETYNRLKIFIEDEVAAGLARDEAVEKLVKEVAYTHLNRLAAFKMMEARKLIRGTLDKGPESNAFKFYLADPEHAEDYTLYRRGEIDAAYRHFLLWQSGQVAHEIRVLFDPDNLVSRLFPRPRALETLLSMLNKEALEDVWLADETVGWIYQYFNEPELQAAFAKVGGGEKFEAEDIPSATQLFTPHWIVRYLVQNTLGRLWVQMHPDTHLIGSELLDYLVPLEGEVAAEPLRPVQEITLLDPACGGMHFGLVAFDLFHAMYSEELKRAGEPGWPEEASVDDEAEIPAAIIKHNLFGIDIDLRAVQLAALALFLKAKSYNKNARITDTNLAVAGVLPLNGARLGAFLRDAHFTRPVYERLLRALWTRLHDARQLGSLLRLEKDLAELVETERKRYKQAPLFAGVPGEFEAAATDEAFWEVVGSQIVRSLHEFAREQAREGHDQTFFVGEAVKGMRLLELMLQEYDVVVTNPPYMNRGKMNHRLQDLVEKAYPDAKSDLYAAFIERCLEFTSEHGYIGMLTMHSFMFITSYDSLRELLQDQITVSSMAHCGPGLFEVGNPATLQTTAFTFQKEPKRSVRDNTEGVYYRLVHAPTNDEKRRLFENALQNGSNSYRLAQRHFDVIAGSPWIYWLTRPIRDLFKELPQLGNVAQPVVGLQTSDNFRFIRLWWESGKKRIGLSCTDHHEASLSGKTWFPIAKGSTPDDWGGIEHETINWANNGKELRAFEPAVIRNPNYYFRPGVTLSRVGPSGFSARLNPGGHILESSNSASFPHTVDDTLSLLGIAKSQCAVALLTAMNPTINFQVGDLVSLPVPVNHKTNLHFTVSQIVRQVRAFGKTNEGTYEFIAPWRWTTGLEEALLALARLSTLEHEANEETYQLYDITGEDRALIEAELSGKLHLETSEEHEIKDVDSGDGIELSLTREELAVRWISYATGVVLGRFQPGIPGALGSAVYRREDFAVGPLPAPCEEEFDTLSGPAGRFDYVDKGEGRHLFSSKVEETLQALAVDDGIAVLDEGHPRDLPTRVEQALQLMLGDEGAREVVEEATGSSSSRLRDSLRGFFDKKFFTNWHFKWYSKSRRKAPVYWPLLSAKRNYGFVLFHERINDQTFYTLQREYLDHKLNSLRLHIEDLRGQAASLSGTALKRVEREIDKTTQLLEEIGDFARTIERVVQEGYQPKPNWIDDGVILRMAPLWELIPIWKSEPKKYWERLQKGEYDWSHIAMNYWPERVRKACNTNKSYAIAHGHVEWYEGE